MSKTVSIDNKFTSLVSHYRDTQKTIELQTKNRDRHFYYILGLLGVMAFRFFSPQTSSSILNEFFQKQLGIGTQVSINYLGSLLWFLLLAVTLRYFQTVINLEKSFNYIHDLEDELSGVYKTRAFTMEGKSYLDKYPIFSDWLHFLYRTLFPFLFIVSVVAKLIGEWRTDNIKIESLYLNTAICVAIIISTILYWFSLRSISRYEFIDKEKKN